MNLIPHRRRVLQATAVLLLLALVLPFAIFAVPQVVGAEHSYVVVSGSMTPAIGVGATVIVNEVPATAIQEGDVITFISGEQATIQGGQAGENLITHRVIDVVPTKDGPKFKTKGDANEDSDPGFVSADALVGRVMFSIPYIGHLIVFAGTKLGFVLLVAIPLGLLVLGEVYDLARAARNSQDASTTTDTDEQAETDGGTDTEQAGTNEQAAADEWRWGD